jgi:hypothetical protein
MTLDLEKMAREWLEGAIGKDFYVPQERAMAPGIAGEWPPFIEAPQSRNGRLKRIETTALLPKLLEFALQEVASRDARIEKLETAAKALGNWKHLPCVWCEFGDKEYVCTCETVESLISNLREALKEQL